jgi:sugar phosphate isomerase/epimerase
MEELRKKQNPVTLFTGQWGDMPLPELAVKAKSWGYDGLELACWGKHLDVQRALVDDAYVVEIIGILEHEQLGLWAISNHLVGQAVCDRIDERYEVILPAHVWGDGIPVDVNDRAAEEMVATAKVAKKLGVKTVCGFTGSPIWHLIYAFPPVSPEMIAEGYNLFGVVWDGILDEFDEEDVNFALEVHPTEIAYDIVTFQRALDAVDFHPRFRINFDPSHLYWQGIEPVELIRAFPERIAHVHVKDAAFQLSGRGSILGSHLPFGDVERGWDFRSVGRGSVNFEEIFRALRQINYTGPLSVEWEDSTMDREFGAKESLDNVRKWLWPAAGQGFEKAFAHE